jgi:ferredoxin-nitrite reductase
MNNPLANLPFSVTQKEYLQGFFAGALITAPFIGHTATGLLTGSSGLSATPNLGSTAYSEADELEETVYGIPVSELSKPERWKHEQNGLDIWDKLVAHAATNKAPDDADNFRFRYFGLFHVAPAQDSFMARLRIPAGDVTSHQLRGLADLSDDCGNGYCDITTRANFQLREFAPKHIIKVLSRIQDLGLSSKGSGADNIRNITTTPTTGFDRDELIDVRPFAKSLSNYILNHRDLFGLPRKFNIAFDSGGSISAAADTNDIGFFAVRLTEQSLASASPAPSGITPGIYFRVELGGISGHGDFAKDI